MRAGMGYPSLDPRVAPTDYNTHRREYEAQVKLGNLDRAKVLNRQAQGQLISDYGRHMANTGGSIRGRMGLPDPKELHGDASMEQLGKWRAALDKNIAEHARGTAAPAAQSVARSSLDALADNPNETSQQMQEHTQRGTKDAPAAQVGGTDPYANLRSDAAPTTLTPTEVHQQQLNADFSRSTPVNASGRGQWVQQGRGQVFANAQGQPIGFNQPLTPPTALTPEQGKAAGAPADAFNAYRTSQGTIATAQGPRYVNGVLTDPGVQMAAAKGQETQMRASFPELYKDGSDHNLEFLKAHLQGVIK